MLVYSDLQGTRVCIGSDEDNSLTRGLVGSTALTDRWCCCVRYGGAVLIGLQGCRALFHEGPSLVFLACVVLVSV
jgi:hypothetical protein